jgi:hypothetical protein
VEHRKPAQRRSRLRKDGAATGMRASPIPRPRARRLGRSVWMGSRMTRASREPTTGAWAGGGATGARTWVAEVYTPLDRKLPGHVTRLLRRHSWRDSPAPNGESIRRKEQEVGRPGLGRVEIGGDTEGRVETGTFGCKLSPYSGMTFQ